MNLSQPAVSRLIKLLEDEIGAKLFHRNQKSLGPTREAEIFYPEALKIISAIDDFPTLFEQLRSNTLVPFRVVSQVRTAHGVVIPAARKFAEKYPEIQINLEILPRRELSRSVMEHQIDVAVHIVPFPVKGLKLLSVEQLSLHVLLPKNNPLANEEFLTPDQLSGERYVALKRGMIARDMVDRELAKTGQRLRVFHQVSGMDAAHQFVAYGMGYTFSDNTAIPVSLRDQVVLVPWKPHMNMQLGIYGPEGSNLHEATPNFIKCIESVIAERKNSGKTE